ncbi:uncharacterized protein LOC104451988 [Eucalyptus grandis]|uniref:Uncharacterized protein n=3 Tax=Eucalyptus TaxID=3932 RepID=A0ACC3KJQ2_EUCGR|nr:uncharacterized protein LOC104451988 [Eucalyptus grandis]KAK3426352.1 hypothetical protein EUGRSUZ_F02821 [Eucalyptus grandis]
MARPMLPRPLVPIKTLVPSSVTSLTSIFLLISILSILSILAFLCASHRKSKKSTKHSAFVPHSSEKKLVSRLNSSISSKALLMAKMMSWRKTEGGQEEEDGEDSDEAIWKKTIIQGERCRPLDFSGKIEYDSKGNIVTA